MAARPGPIPHAPVRAITGRFRMRPHRCIPTPRDRGERCAHFGPTGSHRLWLAEVTSSHSLQGRGTSYEFVREPPVATNVTASPIDPRYDGGEAHVIRRIPATPKLATSSANADARMPGGALDARPMGRHSSPRPPRGCLYSRDGDMAARSAPAPLCVTERTGRSRHQRNCNIHANGGNLAPHGGPS